jgi:hypothetical protein
MPGKTEGYICPVPGCGRRRDDEGYFTLIKAKPLLITMDKYRMDDDRDQSG